MTTGTTDHSDLEIRRYLLGELDEEPAATLERDYFADGEFFDRLWAAEHDLVDDYLAGRLSAHERDRFERHYLASPAHRERVAAARALRSHGATPGSPAVAAPASWTALRRPTWMAAVAAALVLFALGGVWMVRSSRVEPPLDGRAPDQAQPQQPPNAPRPAPVRVPATIAVTLSAIALRGSDDSASVTVPEGTDLVVLHLEGDRSAPRFDRGHAVVRTLPGREIWRGPAVSDSTAPASLARVEVPAGTLTPDDYIVVLLETAANGTDTERYRYFLRVRPR
jgi:hypothetical protein